MRKAEQWAVCSGPHPHKWVHLASSVPSPLAYFKACPSHHISFSLIGISERKLSFRFNRSSLITLHLKFVQLFQTCIKWHGTDVWSGPSERMFLTNRRDLDQAWEWDASGKSAVHGSNVSNKVLRMKSDVSELRQLKRELKWDCEVTLLLWCLWLNVSLGSFLRCKCHTTYEFPVYGIVL